MTTQEVNFINENPDSPEDEISNTLNTLTDGLLEDSTQDSLEQMTNKSYTKYFYFYYFFIFSLIILIYELTY
jgi:hypothetical protein